MIVTLTNAGVVQPFVDIVDMTVSANDTNFTRNGFTGSADLNGETTITLQGAPQVINLVSVFVDGFRLINETLDFGRTYMAYEIQGNQVVFKQPVTGHVEVFYDLPINFTFPEANYIRVNNVQGARTKARAAGEIFAGSFCEPLILTKPAHGFARLTDDHKSILYVPSLGYNGYDAFSYSVVTDRGQLATPKCVYVKVGNPIVAPGA